MDDCKHDRAEMTDAATELARRRERGRRSQAAFRQRQNRAAQLVTDQNRRLKDGIERLVSNTSGDERTGLLNSILDLAEAAGVDAAGTRAGSASEEIASQGDIAINAIAKDLVHNPTDQTISIPFLPQRLSFGIWLDPMNYMRISLPPQDLLPYLGPGSETFAGWLFWSIMEHRQRGCNNSHAEPITLLKKSLAHSEVTQDVGIPFMLDMIDARLEYKQQGSISPKYAAAGEADLGMVVHSRINNDYRSRGKDPSSYLSCVGIEEHIRNMVGDVSFGVLERTARGEGPISLRNSLDILKCRLYDNAVCFGDGPRWSTHVVDSLFLEWMGKALASTL